MTPDTGRSATTRRGAGVEADVIERLSRGKAFDAVVILATVAVIVAVGWTLPQVFAGSPATTFKRKSWIEHKGRWAMTLDMLNRSVVCPGMPRQTVLARLGPPDGTIPGSRDFNYDLGDNTFVSISFDSRGRVYGLDPGSADRDDTTPAVGSCWS
jgi:hypothetical protein